jgi:hypothetical protein
MSEMRDQGNVGPIGAMFLLAFGMIGAAVGLTHWGQAGALACGGFTILIVFTVAFYFASEAR